MAPGRYLLLCGWLSVCAAAPHDANPMHDWVEAPGENLCNGHYMPPPINATESKALMLAADRSEITLDGRSTMYGNVVMSQGERRIEADEAHILLSPSTRDIKSISLLGNVRYVQPGLQVYSTAAASDRAAKQISIEGALYHLYTRHARGEAAHLHVDPRNRAVLKKASYTTCAPAHADWSLYAQKVTFDPHAGWGSAYHARIYMQNIPVLYLPYLSFPLDKRRKSGFLYPSIGHSTQSGTIYEVPVYFNLAPNYDLLLSGDHLTERGNRLSGYFRYLTHSSRGTVDFAFLPNDAAYKTLRREGRHAHPGITDPRDPRLLGLRGLHRAELDLHHHTQWHPDWTASVDYHRVSDDNYFMDFGDGYGAGQTHLLQEVKVTHQSTHWRQMLRMQEYQALHPFAGPLTEELYRRQPQFSFSGDYPYLLPHFGARLSGEWTHFRKRRDPSTGDTPTEGQRAHLRPSLRLPWEETAWHVIPRVQWDITQYDLRRGTQEQRYPHSVTRTIPLYDLKAGLAFERTFQWRGTPAIQTLEPELYYLYVPYQQQDKYPIFDSGPINFSRARMFYDNRFSGIDRIGDAHQITAGLSSQFLRRSDQKERLRVMIAQTLQFRPHRVTICDPVTEPSCLLGEDRYGKDRWSPLMGEVQWSIKEHWTAIGSVGLHQRALEEGALTLQYRGPGNNVLNLGHQYIRVDPSRADTAPSRIIALEQSDISFYTALSQRWHLLGRWHYDHADRQIMDTIAGIEYESCCFALQFTTARVLRPRTENIPSAIPGPRYDQRFYLSIMLKGLSTFGYHRNDTQMTTLIPGYRPFTARDLSP